MQVVLVFYPGLAVTALFTCVLVDRLELEEVLDQVLLRCVSELRLDTVEEDIQELLTVTLH